VFLVGLTHLTVGVYATHWPISGDLITYADWCPGDPNEGATSDVVMMFALTGFCWADADIVVDGYYICKRPSERQALAL